MKHISLVDNARLILENARDLAQGAITPITRLGVTGLARSGKTVFISALVHNLLVGGRLPLLKAYADGRLARAWLDPQPDDDVPRFDYEKHIHDLIEHRTWPQSTHHIAELRVTIEYESASFFNRTFGRGRLHLDIVDYPGEWLLDLPLLGKTYQNWSAETIKRAEKATHMAEAQAWLSRLREIKPQNEEDETLARECAALFTAYLKASRSDTHALSTLPPGRFLMPAELEGSPALTFSPLIETNSNTTRSLAAMMERRYEAYKRIVVKPFFRDHFARLDRQIVLVDTLQALNAGPAAMTDLAEALGEILSCFRPGRATWLSSILSRRIDRILFAATKADHLNHTDHDRLEAIMRELIGKAAKQATFAGAKVDVLALASVRATREVMLSSGDEALPAISGTPIAGENINGEIFDGTTEMALFPGDLPHNPKHLFTATKMPNDKDPAVHFVRFRPPKLEQTSDGYNIFLPHIRLDRALEFLIGDHLA